MRIEVLYNHGKYGFLSNLAEDPIKYKGVTYRTAEGAYQAWKSGQYMPGFEHVTGQTAKVLGYRKPVNTKTNLKLMYEIIFERSRQSDKFRELLLETANHQLIHPVKDKFWAENFPKILMEIRKFVLLELP